MNQYLKKPFSKNKLIFFGIYAFFALALTLFIAISQPEWLKTIAILSVLIIVPFFFVSAEIGLFVLLISRPIMDIISDYTILTVENVSFNLSSVLGIFIFLWGLTIILKHKIKIHKIPLFWPFLIFLMVCLISMFMAESLSSAAGEIIKISNIFIIYILAFDFVKTEKKFNTTIKVLICSIIVPAAVALYQFIFKMGLDFGGLSNRLYGTFGHPNALAFYLVLVITLLLVLASKKYSQRQKTDLEKKLIRQEELPISLSVVLLFILLLFTYTRGAWIGMGIVLFIMGLFRYRKQLVIGLLIIVLAFTCFPLLSNFIINHYQYDLRDVPIVSRFVSKNEDADSWDWRKNMYQEMMPLIWQKPVLGNGLGSFTLVRARTTSNPYEALEAHNDYLRLAIETGLVGIISYALLIIFIFKNAISYLLYTKKHAQNYWLWGVALVGLVIAFYTMSAADNLLRGTAVQWALWTAFAAILATRKFKAQK